MDERDHQEPGSYHDEQCQSCNEPISLVDRIKIDCPHCGEPWRNHANHDLEDTDDFIRPDSAGIQWAWIGFLLCVFFLPHFGFLVCLWVDRNTQDEKAKKLAHYGLQVCKVWLLVLIFAFAMRFFGYNWLPI